MSRSFKKPFGPVASGCRMKEWKRKSNRNVRRSQVDLSDGNHYRRINDVWGSPSDGKTYYGTDPKWQRK